MGPNEVSMIRWVDRRFDFDFPVETAPLLLERLRGTPARLEDRLRSMPPERLIQPDGEKWSIQEHAGHLSDVEVLFAGRLDDYDAGLPALRAADLSGRRTRDANHNAVEIPVLLQRFRQARSSLMARLEALDRAGLARSALHPRLGRPMRVCDMMLFLAEHDDYHLAMITRIWRGRAGA